MKTETSNKILTVPNGLSFLRLLGVPIFFWLITIRHSFGLAVVVLFISGFTDWLDGFLARKLEQQTRFGAMLDPLVDRLYIVAALIALAVTHVIPMWIFAILIARDIYMFIALSVLKRHGFSGFPVHFVGKAATMNLLYALPLLLLGTFTGNVGKVSYVVGWAFFMWGIAMYWYGAFLYTVQLRDVMHAEVAHE